jgi:hypothetical protein
VCQWKPMTYECGKCRVVHATRSTLKKPREKRVRVDSGAPASTYHRPVRNIFLCARGAEHERQARHEHKAAARHGAWTCAARSARGNADVTWWCPMGRFFFQNRAIDATCKVASEKKNHPTLRSK